MISNNDLFCLGIVVLEILILIMALIVVYLWIKTLIFCIKYEENDDSKIKWVLIMFFGGVLGAVIYHLYRRPKIEKMIRKKRKVVLVDE